MVGKPPRFEDFGESEESFSKFRQAMRDHVRSLEIANGFWTVDEWLDRGNENYPEAAWYVAFSNKPLPSLDEGNRGLICITPQWGVLEWKSVTGLCAFSEMDDVSIQGFSVDVPTETCAELIGMCEELARHGDQRANNRCYDGGPTNISIRSPSTGRTDLYCNLGDHDHPDYVNGPIRVLFKLAIAIFELYPR